MEADDALHWLLVEGAPVDAPAPHRVRLESAGRRLPSTVLTTSELMASTRHRTRIDLERLTGIHERRVSVGKESSLTLAVGAANDCLRRSSHAATDLDVLVSCSITKSRDDVEQWLEPSMSSAVADAIGARDAITFDVSNACAGMLTGVFLLHNWIRQGIVQTGMIVSGENISHLGHNAAQHVRSILSRELASLTLGDAGAALVLERAPDAAAGIDLVGFTTVAGHSRLCLAHPARHEPGARMFTDSRGIHRAAIGMTAGLLDEALTAAGLEMAGIDCVIPHQTSARAIRQGMAEVTAELGAAPRHEAVVTVDRYGNTASTTHTVALVEELRAGRLHAGDRIALVALASGIEIGVVLLTLDEETVARCGHDD
jgi:3-oxoacyl-[acyl-carrier-protein] synthase-3